VTREPRDQRLADGGPAAGLVGVAGAHARHHPPHVDGAALQHPDDPPEPGLEVEVGMDAREGAIEGPGVEGRLDDRMEQRVLVGEGPEDGALGDAGGLRDLPGGNGRAVVADERDRSVAVGRAGRRRTG